MSDAPASGEAAKYEVLGPLGRGADSEVLLARTVGAAGFVKLAAIKRLLPERAMDQDLVTRFLDEARLSARLNHANIVTIFDVAHDAAGPFVAMELLEGQPLRDLLRTSGPLPPEIALRVFADAASALQYAHELHDHRGQPLGIVHRAVSPKNVFVLYSGQAKLVNFARSRTGDTRAETRTSDLSEAVRYLAPEQTRGVVEPRVDVFGAGVVLWECLTGAPFWGERSDLEILRLLTLPDGFDPPRLGEHLPTASPALEALCARAVHADPEQRFATVREMLESLEALLAAEGLTARPREVGRYLQTKMGKHVEESRSSLQKLIVAGAGATASAEPLSTDVVLEGDDADVALPGPAAGPRAGRRWSLALAAVVLAGVSAFLVARSLRATDPVPLASAPSVTRPSAPAMASAPASSAAAASAEVSVDLEATPSSAQITFDGEPVANPFHVTRPADASLHVVRVAGGSAYEPFERSIPLVTNTRLSIELAALGATQPPAPHGAAHGPAASHRPSPSHLPPPSEPPGETPTPTIPSFDSQPLVAGGGKPAPTTTLDTSNPWKN